MEDRIYQVIDIDGTLLAQVEVLPETSGAAITYIYGNWHSPDNLDKIANTISEAATYLRTGI